MEPGTGGPIYDDGAPLGSIQDPECQIDAIAQSWAVLSGAGDSQRSRQAMQSVLERLVLPTDRLMLLFTPPFDKTPRDPGYIKGYLPGTRENGGQYTHAATWTAWAFATLGDGKQAGALFDLLNPIFQSDTEEKASVYRVEPYVIAQIFTASHPMCAAVGGPGIRVQPPGCTVSVWRPFSASKKLEIPCTLTRSFRLPGMDLRFVINSGNPCT